MAKHGDDRTGNLVCSFCGKSQDEVRKLIAGPTVYICDECIDLCNEIIEEEGLDDAAGADDVTGDRDLRCTFCSKHADEVGKLIAGPTVYICNQCTALANDIAIEEADNDAERRGPRPRGRRP